MLCVLCVLCGRVQGGHSEFKLRAESEEERDAWIASIEQELSKHEFHDMLKLKKDQVNGEWVLVGKRAGRWVGDSVTQ